MNLLFTINQQYVSQFIICFQSIIRFHNQCHIYIFHTDLSLKDQERIQNSFLSSTIFHFIKIDTQEMNHFPTTHRYPVEIYLRIFAAQYLPSDIDKILYLDADTIVINPLDSLYEMNIENDYYAGATHVRSFLTKMNHIRLKEYGQYPYINTGVLLMNLKNLRQYQNQEDVFDFINRHEKNLLLPDQDIISVLYGQHIQLIDAMKYNLSDRILSIYNHEHFLHPKTIDWIRKNTVIIHYCGKNKPWNQKYYGQLDIFYQEVKQ